MSKKANKNNTVSYTPTVDLPKLKTVPTKWDMVKHYYKSTNDPQIEADVVATEKVLTKFAKKYQKADFTKNAKTLKRALDDYFAIDALNTTSKPLRYLGLLSALNSLDEVVQKKINLLGQRLTRASNQLVFFTLKIGKIDKKAQKELLKAPELADYHYYLKTMFETAKHDLSEAEEKIVRLLGDCSYGMWVDMTEKMVSRRTISHAGGQIPVNEAFGLVDTLPFKQQPAFWDKIMTAISDMDETVEHELTAVATRKKISDEVRGFEKPYSASILSHEDDAKSVEALIEAVSTRGFALSKKFYKLKAKLHDVDKIQYAQRNAQLGNTPLITYEQATEICRDVFYVVHPLYGEIFDRLLINGQIDAYPKAGKRGGAFCSGDTAQPTKVFLNHTDTLSSLETYAHEMGHAIHTERSKTQPVHYEGYSTTTAETASTLFEGLLFDKLLEQVSEKDQFALLHFKLIRDISTIQRQIAFHNFELNMHEFVREHGAISRTELNQMMQTHLKSYCGPAVDIGEKDGHSYIYISHFRYGFYVYTYTFGTLMSTIMTEEFKTDPTYAEKIDTFLTAGGSDTVSNIFKSIGLNTKKIETFMHGLDRMDREIKMLQKLSKQHLQ